MHFSPFVVEHDERHEPEFKQLSHVKSLQHDSRAVGPGLGVWVMLERSPYSHSTLAIKSRRVDHCGVIRAHDTGYFVYTGLVSNSYW